MLHSLYLWFDQVKMARMLTGTHGKTIFPGVKESGVCGNGRTKRQLDDGPDNGSGSGPSVCVAGGAPMGHSL